MARHRDIRNMDYEDEYDGYDDIYGHSMEDDYYISPSNRQFIYNRETARDSRLEPEDDIPEVDAIDELSDTDRIKVESCFDEIKNSLGPSDVSRAELINLVLKYNFNVELVINAILEDPKYKSKIGEKEKDVSHLNLNKFTNPEIKICDSSGTNNKKRAAFHIPSFSMNKLSSSPKPQTFVNPNLINTTKEEQSCSAKFIIPSVFNSELTINALDISSSSPKKFAIPNIFEDSSKSTDQTGSSKKFKIPNIFCSKSEGNSVSNVNNPGKGFNITNMFEQNEQLCDKARQVEVDKLNTLSELASSHLKNTISLSEMSVNNSKTSADHDNEIASVSKRICSLIVAPEKINISKSLLLKDMKNNFNIDLSKALKPTGSLPKIPRNMENVFTAEKFDIPFIDSDILLNKDRNDRYTKVIKKTRLPCNMDMRKVFDFSKMYGKNPTKFGKILGRKYKHIKEGVYHHGMHLERIYPIPKAVKVFSFNTKSPDDFIISHLKSRQ